MKTLLFFEHKYGHKLIYNHASKTGWFYTKITLETKYTRKLSVILPTLFDSMV